MSAGSKRLRLIGVGSPFGDDRLGWEALERLAFELAGENVDTLCLDRPGPQLLAEMDGWELVVLIDAMDSAAAPGTVRRLDPAELLPRAENLSSHAFGVAETLALGARLGRLPAELHLFGIEMGATHDVWLPALRRELQALLGERTQTA